MSDLKLYTDQVQSEKIILGIPFYGYEWIVEDGNDPQSFTIPKTGQTATYERITNLLATPTIKTHWDAAALSPYLRFDVKGKHHIIYYDNALSLAYKLQLVRQANLGGIAIWALGYEGSTQELWTTIGKGL